MTLALTVYKFLCPDCAMSNGTSYPVSFYTDRGWQLAAQAHARRTGHEHPKMWVETRTVPDLPGPAVVTDDFDETMDTT